MSRFRYLAALTALAVLLAACGSNGDDEAATDDDVGGDEAEEAEDDGEEDDGEGSGDGPVIGVSWNNFQEERWPTWDEPAIQEALEESGASYISTDASSSAEQQIEDVQNLITQGAEALIILAQDGTAILPAVESAIEQGVPVVAYDRLIEHEEALYITFDNVEVGRMQAREIYDRVPEGNYVFIKGNQADANADFLRSGQAEILDEAVEAGDIENVGESYTDNWDPAIAQRNMEQFLTENDNDVDAVVASNDGTAGGVIAALESQGLAGEVPVSGQDADGAALNRVALGTQTVSVWKDARELGYRAGEAAVQLAEGTALEDIPDTVMFDSPEGNQLVSLLLEPIPITQENLDEVVDAEWISEEELCQGVE
ncbi:MAG: D-xylose ABC transporter substrate-binding protein, partial [Nitriliruptoraceae bacterium]